jgi:hypothetical protein
MTNCCRVLVVFVANSAPNWSRRGPFKKEGFHRLSVSRNKLTFFFGDDVQAVEQVDGG